MVIRVRVGLRDARLEEGERERLKLNFNKNLVFDIIQIGEIVI